MFSYQHPYKEQIIQKLHESCPTGRIQNYAIQILVDFIATLKSGLAHFKTIGHEHHVFVLFHIQASS